MNSPTTVTSPELNQATAGNQTYLNNLKITMLLTTDLLMVVVSIVAGFVISHYARIIFHTPTWTGIETSYTSLIVPFIIPTLLLLLSLSSKGHYSRFRPFWDEYREVIRDIVLIMGVVTAYLFMTKAHFSRFWFFSAWVSAIIMIPVGRILIRKIMIKLKVWYKATLLIGPEEEIYNALAIEEDYYLGNKIEAVMVYGETNGNSHSSLHPYPTIPVDAEPCTILQEMDNPQVVIQMSPDNHEEQIHLIERFSRCISKLPNCHLSVIPPIGQIPLLGTETYHLFSEEMIIMRFKNNLNRKWSQIAKRIFDVIVSTILLITLSPLFLILILLIKKDGGSAFFGHERIGQNRKKFKCYKFRSMAMNADELLEKLLATNAAARAEWDKDFKLKEDPRITSIGNFIRKTSMDELPQLWNVLKGEMSLVGPRPVIEEELERYADKVSYYLDAKPGITGLWQVSGRNDVDYNRRVQLDSWYVRNWSLWYDIVILLKTIDVVIYNKGAY